MHDYSWRKARSALDTRAASRRPDLRFLFGDHVLDTTRRELRRGGEHIALEPQVFDVLVYLLQNRERVVSKDDLLASVWGGRIVSDAALDSRIAAARRAVGDSGETQTLIRTFARKELRPLESHRIFRGAEDPRVVRGHLFRRPAQRRNAGGVTSPLDRAGSHRAVV